MRKPEASATKCNHPKHAERRDPPNVNNCVRVWCGNCGETKRYEEKR